MSKTSHVIYLTLITVLLASIAKHLVGATGNLDDSERVRFQSALIERSRDYENVQWLGHPVWQPVLDLWTFRKRLPK